MKVLYITYDGISDALGQSQIVPYINGLSALGNDITVLSFEKENISNCCRNRFDKKVCWKMLSYHKYPLILSTIFDIMEGMRVGAVILLREKINVIHVRGYVPAVIGSCLKRLFGIRFIFDMRGMWPEEKVDARAWKKSGLFFKIVKCFEKYFLYSADTIIVLTDRFKQIIATTRCLGAKKIRVIPTCVDINNFSVSRSGCSGEESGVKGKFTILYLGSLGTFYALVEMIDFFSIIQTNIHFKNPHFRILTNNPSDVIHQAMQLRNIPKRNYSIRQIPHVDLKDALPLADVSLMFYKRSLSGAGCCPTKFGESLACGLPVIINAGIGDTESIIESEKIGVIVKEFTSEAYRDAMERLIPLFSNKEELRLKCHQAAIKHFSLNKGIDAYQEIYHDLA